MSQNISQTTQEHERVSRLKSESLDNILHQRISVLDHGALSVLEYMGNDTAIVEAARISYGSGTKKTRDDGTLIDYLFRNKHTSPFEMCEIMLYVKLPVFIAAQWIRHRTANINSYSARYSEMPDEFYIPQANQLNKQHALSRQCSGDALDLTLAEGISAEMLDHSKKSYAFYKKLINDGVSRELARMVLPQNIYTSWYWKIDLHNLTHFLTLRIAEHAQAEIRAYAQVILHDIVAKWVPLTYNAFCKYRLGAKSVSSLGKNVIQDAINGNLKTREDYTDILGHVIGKSEWLELMDLINVRQEIK